VRPVRRSDSCQSLPSVALRCHSTSYRLQRICVSSLIWDMSCTCIQFCLDGLLTLSLSLPPLSPPPPPPPFSRLANDGVWNIVSNCLECADMMCIEICFLRERSGLEVCIVSTVLHPCKGRCFVGWGDCYSVIFLEGLKKATKGLRIVGGPVGIGTWYLGQYVSGNVLGRRVCSVSRLATTRRVLTGGVAIQQQRTCVIEGSANWLKW
jgi:hypothetical protein